MQKIEPNYWAFCANPKLYKIEQAVHELSEDSWQVPRGNVRRGDRAVIWKTKGNDKHRGIVALAEVLTDVVPDKPLHPEYWLDFDSTDKVINRVKIRYIVPPTLPLWENSADLNVLSELSVARATGGTIFHVTADQWSAIMSAIGGWPSTPPEIEEIEAVIAEHAGKKRYGQGFLTNAVLRSEIEHYAMQRATSYYQELGWSVSDVSATHSYDLLCHHDKFGELHVEVKGTTSNGEQVLLTANEVKHARNQYPRVALFILSRIHVNQTSGEHPQVSGGEIHILYPWNINEGALSSLAYTYTLPKE